jgi:hypothetical protein
MTTSLNNHRPAHYAVAATGLVGILVAITLHSAPAMAGNDSRHTVTGGTVQGPGHDVVHNCFIAPDVWDEALDGPLPRCSTHVP